MKRVLIEPDVFTRMKYIAESIKTFANLSCVSLSFNSYKFYYLYLITMMRYKWLRKRVKYYCVAHNKKLPSSSITS